MSQNLPNTQKGKATRQWLLDNTVAQNYDDEEAILHSDVQKDANLFKRQLRDAQADHLQPTRSLENLQRELEEEEELEQWSQADLKDVRTFTNTFKKKIPYYVPMFKWVRSYSKDDLIGDVLAAITTATMLVPQGLAYAILAGLPPVLGLYTGWMPLIVYSVMGGCKQLAIGPEALLAVLLGSLLDRYEVHEAVEVAHMMAFVVGIISFIFGAVRFGFMHNVISRWVLAGFINAVALIIALSQLDTLLGFKFERGLDPYEKFIYACVHIKNTNGHTIGMAIAGITFLFLMKYLKGFLGRNGVKNAKYIPDVMMLVIGGIVFMYFTRWNEDYGVKVLGTIEGGFPKPITPQFNLEAVQELAGDCLLIVIVGFVEATAVSRTLATKHGYQISSNRELVAFGIANLLGSFFQIYPCFASIPRTSIQDAAGSRTCLCGFLVSCFCLIVVLFLTPLFYYLPNVVMGSIIFVAAFGLVEIHEAQFLWKTKSWKDFAQFWIAALATFILGVELGVLTAVGMCIFLVLKQASTPQVYSVLGRTEDGQFKDVSKFPDASAIEGVILVRIDEILTFANMGEFKLLLENLESIKDSTEGKKATIAAVVLNFRNMSSLDASALLTFDEMIHAYHSKGIKVGFVEVSSTVMDRFAIAGLKELVGNEFFFETNQDAVDYIETNVTKTKQVSSPTVPAASSATTGESSSSSYQRDYSEPQAEDLPTIPSTPTISEGKLVDNDILVDTADSDDDASPSLPTSHALLHSSSDHHHDYMDPANNRDPY